MIKKLVSSLLIVAAIITAMPVGASASWKNDNVGWWNTEGDSYSTGWKQIDGSWYNFGSDGYMRKGWLQDGSSWYYLKDNGTMATSKLTVDGKVYEFDSNGKWMGNKEVVTNNVSTQNDNNISQNLIYETNSGSIKYKVYTSRSVDTLLIAAALHNNFKGNYLMPNSDQVELFKAAKEYFSPYANHEFIKNFSKYMASNKDDDVNSSLIGILLSYTDLPELSPKFDVGNKLPEGMKSKENLDEFLAQLKSFYNDTHAEDFFKKNSSHYDALASYIKKNEEKSSTIKLINAAVDYTGNEEDGNRIKTMESYCIVDIAKNRLKLVYGSEK